MKRWQDKIMIWFDDMESATFTWMAKSCQGLPNVANIGKSCKILPKSDKSGKKMTKVAKSS